MSLRVQTSFPWDFDFGNWNSKRRVAENWNQNGAWNFFKLISRDGNYFNPICKICKFLKPSCESQLGLGFLLQFDRLTLNAAVFGEICYKAFKHLADQHNFPPDFPSAEVAAGMYSQLLSHPKFYSAWRPGRWQYRRLSKIEYGRH